MPRWNRFSRKRSAHQINLSDVQRQNIQRAVDAMGFDYRSFTPSAFVHTALAFRKRPLELLQRGFDLSLHGLFCATVHTDYIVVNSQLHPLHRAHVLLHEAAHVVLGHDGTASVLKEIPDLLPFVKPDAVVKGHMRRLDDSRDDPIEIEAEEFVIEVQRRVALARRHEMFFGMTSSIPSARPYTDMLELRFSADD